MTEDNMRNMPRILLLLFGLCVATMMFIARCGLNIDATLRTGAIMTQQGNQHEREIHELKQQLAHLQVQLEIMKEGLNNSSAQRHSSLDQEQSQSNPTQGFNYEEFLNRNLENAEILHGISMDNEFQLFPFNSFTLDPARIYLNDPGLGKRVVEMPIGFKRKDLNEIVEKAIDVLSAKTNYDEIYSLADFIEGIYRTEPTSGSQYELYFRHKDSKKASIKDEIPTKYSKVIMFRPFAPLQVVSTEHINTNKELINLILPLSGRLESFKNFLDHFVEVCVKNDKRIFLTVVYFGTDGLPKAKSMLSRLAKKFKFKDMKLVALNETFSRGRGLQVGAKSWPAAKGDVLIFLCDVDVVFSVYFLERCRLNAEKGERVYYPIVFSLYNPHVVYKLHEMPIPGENEQLVVSKETGFWRDFGYGMTCQYLSDFNKVGGFDEQINGWGGEDVMLYRKYVKSTLMTIRATDRGIFHIWHEKKCDPALSSDQYSSCIRSKALNEASHAQLGLLAFKDEIDIHRSYKKNNRR